MEKWKRFFWCLVLGLCGIALGFLIGINVMANTCKVLLAFKGCL